MAGGVHRLRCRPSARRGRLRARRRAPDGQRLRAAPRADRGGAAAAAQRNGDLPGPGRLHGFPAKYSSVKRFVRKLAGAQSPEARVVIETAPGEEAQVDYGEGRWCAIAQSGKYRRTRLFVLTLGFSRKSVRLMALRSSSRTWAELHEESLASARRPCPHRGARQSARRACSRPTSTTRRSTLCTAICSHHYGITALPCRVRDPDRKGKVESGVGHAQRTPLKGLRFETLEEAQRYLDHWEERWADTRIHGTTKRQVAAMFAEEKPALQPLPSSRSATTSTANASCTSTATWRWSGPTTPCRPAASAPRSRAVG